jgi:hypothetical protein
VGGRGWASAGLRNRCSTTPNSTRARPPGTTVTHVVGLASTPGDSMSLHVIISCSAAGRASISVSRPVASIADVPVWPPLVVQLGRRRRRRSTALTGTSSVRVSFAGRPNHARTDHGSRTVSPRASERSNGPAPDSAPGHSVTSIRAVTIGPSAVMSASPSWSTSLSGRGRPDRLSPGGGLWRPSRRAAERGPADPPRPGRAGA